MPGEIWWLAAALAVLSMVFSTGFGGYSPFEFWYYGWGGPTMTDALRLAALLPANAPALLALVWALWLRHITRKNTEREQRRSLLRGLKNAFLARDLKLPVQKRLRRRSLVRNLALWAIMLTAVLCCVPVYEMLWNSSLTVICVFVPAFALIGVLEIFWIRRDWTLVRDIGLLADQVTAIRDGDLETPLDLPADADLHQTAEQLNDIQAGLHRALAEQTRSERMKVELISNVSHDLKTPLTSVIGYLTLLRDEPQISPEIRARYTGIALEKAERLEDLINEFFDITRFNLSRLELERQSVDLTRMLEQVASEFRPIFAESGLSCSLDLPPKLHYSCDPDKLARVFDNLLRNASYYSLPDSTVEIAGRIEAGKIVLTFSNAGKNIPQEKLDRIFEQFFRLDSSRATRTGGAGLGLAIAKEIVELHGGTIRADSTEDRITFTICLPSDHSEAP